MIACGPLGLYLALADDGIQEAREEGEEEEDCSFTQGDFGCVGFPE